MVCNVKPSSLLESMLGLLSRILNIEAAESMALVESGAKAELWEIPIAETEAAKKTCDRKFTSSIGIIKNP